MIGGVVNLVTPSKNHAVYFARHLPKKLELVAQV